MSELKTLKDMPHLALPKGAKELLLVENTIDNITFLSETLLRREAIRWIKNCKVELFYKVNNGKEKKVRCSKNHRCGGCSRFIEFFNITEEDLK